MTRGMNPHEEFCLRTATHFTAVRGRVLSGRTVKRFATIADAEKFAKSIGDGKTMIYAVNALGNSAHIKNA